MAGSVTYNAGEVIGKSLIAIIRVPVYSNWLPGKETVIGYVEPGNTCGVVFSFVGGNNGIPLYWMFLTPDKTAYFIKHDPNAFNTTNVIQQMQVDWIKSLEGKAQAAVMAQEIEEKGAFMYYLEKYGAMALYIGGGYFVFKEVMKYLNNKK